MNPGTCAKSHQTMTSSASINLILLSDTSALFFKINLHYKFVCKKYNLCPGGVVLGSIFARYVPLASQNPYPIIAYSVAN